MTTYRTGNHWGVTIVREAPASHSIIEPAQLIAVVVNGDQALAERICALLNADDSAADAIRNFAIVAEAATDLSERLRHTDRAQALRDSDGHCDGTRCRHGEVSVSPEDVAARAELADSIDRPGWSGHSGARRPLSATDSAEQAPAVGRDGKDALSGSQAPTRPRLNGPMVDRLRKCAADTSPNWDGKITIYPPEARELVALIDAEAGGKPQPADSCTCDMRRGPDPACPVHHGRRARGPKPPPVGPGCVCDGSGRPCPRHGAVI